jgi:hypothetical protein
MRKLLALMMVVVMGVALLAIAGCGSGDTSTAKTDLKAADAAYNKLSTDLAQLQTTLVPVLGGALTGDYSNVTTQNLQTAEAKVDSLKGVDDYKAYADAMQKVVTMNEQLLTQGLSLIQALTPLAGNAAAIQQYFQANSNLLPQLQEASNAATKAYNDAQQIKKDKNLTW